MEGRVDVMTSGCYLVEAPSLLSSEGSRTHWKEINPEYSLEGLMLKLKLQYFGHLMKRANSLEKTRRLGKIEGRKRRGWQRRRWLNGITDVMDMNLGKLWEMVKDRRPGMLACGSPWGHEELDTTWWLNHNKHFGKNGTTVRIIFLSEQIHKGLQNQPWTLRRHPSVQDGAGAGMTRVSLRTKMAQGLFCLHLGCWSSSYFFPTSAWHFLLLPPGEQLRLLPAKQSQYPRVLLWKEWQHPLRVYEEKKKERKGKKEKK